jgi:hypothetical protein
MERDLEEMTLAEVFEEAKKELAFLPPVPEIRNAFGESFLWFWLIF